MILTRVKSGDLGISEVEELNLFKRERCLKAKLSNF
jgi:hypothetical protein